MNKHLRNLLLAVVMATTGLATNACVVHTTPSTAVPTATVVTGPPARVYYNGRYLYYRSGAYHYYSRGAWVVSPSVPVHVTRYHRPARPYHVHHGAHRPSHVSRSGRTVYQRRATRPTHVEHSRSRRTYRR